MSSVDAYGLEKVVGARVTETEFRKGTRTLSSMRSYTILTAVSSCEGCGGVKWFGEETRRSRTSDGRLTSRGPLGVM